VTAGGTGFSPRDWTPEATLDIAERQVPGIPEAMRAYSMTKTSRAMLSRAVSALRGRTLIVNLPGSPKATRENLEYVLPTLKHGLEIMIGRVRARGCAEDSEQS
jgi:molybdenum cofactor synthesis domain-containing protein